MLGRVAGRMQHRDRDIAEFEHVAVAHAAEREIGRRFGEQHVFGAGSFRERRPAETWSA